MSARTGAEFLEGLRRTNREIWVGNERVDDVTAHPQLAGGAAALAAVFDRQHECATDCLMPDPETGEPINVSHMLPRSKDDLLRRHIGLARVSETTAGLMGRTPDYMNVTFAGFAANPGLWQGSDGANGEGYDNLVRFQKRLAREDLSLTHTIVHPTNDRMNDSNFKQNRVPVRKVAETAESIIVRGGRILSTLAPFADELAIYPGVPLPGPGHEEFALSFAIPIDAPGLHFLCRDSVATPGADPFDRPLSTRFDEQDAFVIFDDVEVAKNRIFIDGNEGVYNTVIGSPMSPWWPNIMQQTTLRALTKLEFVYSLTTRMAEAVNDLTPHTLEALGELQSYVECTRSALLLAEEHAHDYGDGFVFPDARPLHPMRSLLATWFPRAHEIMIQIGSHNLLAAPSRAMLDDATLRPLIDEFLHGANGIDAERRAALYRLAWDYVGSSLGARNDLYERNYLASARTNRTASHMRYADRSHGDELVERMLSSGDRR